MTIDEYGASHYSIDELCDLLYQNKSTTFDYVKVTDPEEYNSAVAELFVPYTKLEKYEKQTIPITEFDKKKPK